MYDAVNWNVSRIQRRYIYKPVLVFFSLNLLSCYQFFWIDGRSTNHGMEKHIKTLLLKAGRAVQGLSNGDGDGRKMSKPVLEKAYDSICGLSNISVRGWNVALVIDKAAWVLELDLREAKTISNPTSHWCVSLTPSPWYSSVWS